MDMEGDPRSKRFLGRNQSTPLLSGRGESADSAVGFGLHFISPGLSAGGKGAELEAVEQNRNCETVSIETGAQEAGSGEEQED
jgi:hypothetical protein